MNARERAEYLADASSAARSASFEAAQRAAEKWTDAHPVSLDDLFAFLEDYQSIFGPLVPGPRLSGTDFRL